MAADPMLIISARIISARPGLALDHPQARTIRSAVADYWALTKPEVSFLIAIATFTGFYLALPASVPDLPWLRLMNTLLGTLLVASGTGTLNQFIERSFDAQMRRTARRPIASGRNQSISRSLVRDFVVAGRLCVPGVGCGGLGIFAGSRHHPDLSISVHATQTK